MKRTILLNNFSLFIIRKAICFQFAVEYHIPLNFSEGCFRQQAVSYFVRSL